MASVRGGGGVRVVIAASMIFVFAQVESKAQSQVQLVPQDQQCLLHCKDSYDGDVRCAFAAAAHRHKLTHTHISTHHLHTPTTHPHTFKHHMHTQH